MSVILWILQAYGSYRIGWQLQLLDPDPGLCDTLQSKYCKWQHLIAFMYLSLLGIVMGDPNKQVMQLLQAYMLSSLILAAWIDHYIQLIPDVIYAPGLTGGILWLIYYNPGADIIINLIVFVSIQLLIFRRLYGGSDCLAYILCAVYLAGNGCGKKLTDYLLFMLLTVIIELIDQIRKKNILKNGRLKRPVPLIPYIAGAMLLYGFFNKI